MAAASSVAPLGLLQMQTLQLWIKGRVPPHTWCTGRLALMVTQGYVKALVPRTSPHLYLNGTRLGPVSRRKVVLTDPS